MSNTSDIDLSGVPDWALSALDREPQAQVAESALSYKEDAAWPLLVEAAVVNTFLPQDLAPDAVQSQERSHAENVVLNFAETSRTPDGKLQWSLNNETRAEVIKATINTSSLRHAIDRTSGVFHDPGSEALRKCLSEEPVTENLDLNSLEATRTAVSLLSRLLPDLPNLANLDIQSLDREIEYRRLLRVFERMIGRRPKPDGTKPIERFYGRDNEIEALRDYVGVVPAETVRSRFRRGINWLTRKISGRAPFVLWGVGGVGKTTLVSKFMLEHAEAAVGRFPFSYLDFDRNTISARRPSGLLMEMCQQVGAQFDKLTQPMADLRLRTASLARTFDVTTDYESTSNLTSYTQEFRKLIDDFLSHEESTFEWARPFLLVFDTFEVVQYSTDDVINLEEFVSSFSYSQENRLWNRLRLIISGRNPVEMFLGAVESRELGALDESGSRAMLIDLASDAKKHISEGEAQELVAAVAKATGEKTGGVQPLRLKLIGNLFETEEDDGPTIVRSLLDELRKPLEPGGLAASVLIDGILVRRVLAHVRDDRVKTLADPGLVVRRITPEVIKEVMTRATTDPSVNEPEGTDGEPSPPWVVDDLEAQRIFDEFGKEGTLVEPDDIFPYADSPIRGLRHRGDVRRQMLPLIRLRRPNRFGLVHRLAFDYFSRDVEAKKRDGGNEMPSAAEAIYHGLWLNHPLKEIDALWSDAPGFDPRIDADEFEKRSPANIYIRAKSGKRLRINELDWLPPLITLNWFRRRSSDLLEERRIENAINAIRSVAGPDYAALGDDLATAAVLSRLLYRAGRWDECYGLAAKYLDASGLKELVSRDQESRFARASDAPQMLSLFRTGLTIEAKSELPGQLMEHVFDITLATADPVTVVELSSHTILANTRRSDHERFVEMFKPIIDEKCRLVLVPTWKLEQRVLRLAVITTRREDLLHQWVSLRDRIPRECGARAIIDMFGKALRERRSYNAVVELDRKFREEESGTVIWNLIDTLWREEKPAILEALERGELLNECWQLVLFEHSDWVRALGNALTRVLQSEEGGTLLRELDITGYWNRKRRTRQGRERDGVGIVQAAADEGRLLELAQMLVNGRDRLWNRDPKDSANQYPQDVFHLAAAILNWHEIIERYPPPH